MKRSTSFWSGCGFKRMCPSVDENLEDTVDDHENDSGPPRVSGINPIFDSSGSDYDDQDEEDQQRPTPTSSLPPPQQGSFAVIASATCPKAQASGQVDLARNKFDQPKQPSISFPSTKFGKVSRSFQQRWYQQWSWLECSVEIDAAFCFACRFFVCNPDPSFTSLGFKDWKHATGQKGMLNIHCNSKSHTEAMASWQEYRKRMQTDESVSCQLDRVGSKTVTENRKYVRVVMEAILFCCQQGIALRGHDESQESLNPGNFLSLITLLSRHSPEVHRRLQESSSSATWLSPMFQNEIIVFFSEEVRCFIKGELHDAKYFTVLADETKDISKREQLSIAFRYIKGGKTIERFVGYTLATDLTAMSLANYITSKMSQFELNTDYLVSQCYDGASVMSGCNAGVQKLIRETHPQALYVHCCAHRLNLVLVDVCKNVRAAADFFSHLQTLYVFLSSSKTHELFLSNQQATGGREIRLKKLSDTRWSCRIDSITTFLSTYSAIIRTLEDVADGSDREKAIQASGIISGVQSYPFIVALTIYKRIFSVSGNLSDLLQSQSIDLASATCLIQSTIDTFKGLRCDERWELIWQEICSFARHHNIEPNPPMRRRRQKRGPSRLSDFVVTSETLGCNDDGDSTQSLSDCYKTSVYFATLDVIIAEMNERFNDSTLSILKAVDALHPKSDSFLSVPKLEPLIKHYHVCLPSDDNVENEIATFKNYLQRNPISELEGPDSLHNIHWCISQVGAAFPLLSACYQIALTLGTSTASVERSFSSLRRLKTYLRSTMTQQRLDNLSLLYVEREMSSELWDKLDDLVIKFAQKHKNSRIVLF